MKKKVESKTMLDEILEINKKSDWIKQIEDFCNLQGILPIELIDTYKKWNQVKNKPEISKVKEKEQSRDKSIGKHYSPFDNPLYKSKMAAQNRKRD